jgi:ABC-type amino acid transport substrate-binding protein
MARLLVVPLLLLLLLNSFTSQAAESRLNQIKQTKTIKIAYRADATPFAFSSSGEPSGYTIDICKLIVSSLENQLDARPINMKWIGATAESRFNLISDGAADMECGSSTVTLNRMKQVDFSSIIFAQSTGVVVKKSSGLNRVADLTGKAVAVIKGTTNEQALRTINDRAQLNATIVPVKDRAEGVALLESGRADAFASDKILLAGAKYQNPDELTLLPEDLSFEPYAIVLPRGDSDFRLAVNTALARLVRSGAIFAVYDKWFSRVGLQPTAFLEALFLLAALPE